MARPPQRSPCALRRTTLAAASLLAAQGAPAQDASPGLATLPPVTVVAPQEARSALVAGFGDVPLSRSPLQAEILDTRRLDDSGERTLRALARFDPSTSDAYNSIGYIDYLTVRGFVIDNRYNYRRDGLPINAETSIPLDNKAAVELLKGTSGIQAGTSAPGGLVNLVVKRPEDADLRRATLAWQGAGSVLGAIDLSTRFGSDRAFGLRLNAAAERLDPELHDARGQRRLLALAGDWRLGPGTLVEAEVETSHRSQPSQPGFSLLGDRVPDAREVNPRINLNNQPWTQPVVLDGDTASLRLQQRLNADWRATVHAATQHLHSDDRAAFPFGCSAEGHFDRYCSDGTLDLYDYRSDNERRRTDALDASLTGRLETAGLRHDLDAGVLLSRFTARFRPQINNVAGIGNVEGTAVVPPNPDATTPSTDRDERNTEFYLRDVLRFSDHWSVWLGLRHTRLRRESVDTSGEEATNYRQHVTTPWLALNYEWQPGRLVYASWGQGIESQVVPNRPDVYDNAGQALPPLKSRQGEAGLKLRGDVLGVRLAAFQVDRPVFALVGTSQAADGRARHRGIEAALDARLGPWQASVGALLLHARRQGSADDAVNGQRPTNVPARTLKAALQYRVAALPGLALLADAIAESDRTLLPDDGSKRVPGWLRLDLGARYTQRLGATRTLVWRLGLDNALDRRAWQDTPYQFEHVYLFPMAPRTLRASLSADL